MLINDGSFGVGSKTLLLLKGNRNWGRGVIPPPQILKIQSIYPIHAKFLFLQVYPPGFSDLPTVLCCNLAIWIWECIWEEVKKKNFLKVEIRFFFKSLLNREWYVCDNFFLSRKKWNVYIIIFNLTTYNYFWGDFFFKAWISATHLYAIVVFIFAQIWNNCRVGTGYINRQIHIHNSHIFAFYFSIFSWRQGTFFLDLKHTCISICCLFFCDCSKE